MQHNLRRVPLLPTASALTTSWPQLFAFSLAVAFAMSTGGRASAQLTVQKPESVGMSAERLEGIREIVDTGLAKGAMPGCVICVGRRGAIVYHEAFGFRQTKPDKQPMTKDTVFDMASITKPVATATSVMKLLEDGKLRLQDRLTKHLPEMAPHGKNEITIHDLLVHQSGLIPDNPLKDYLDGPELAWQRICELQLTAPVGEQFKYSDVNFIVLAKLVERLSGKDIHAYSQEAIFAPLKMRETGYLPRQALRARAAATQMRGEKWMQGEVHDPRAHALGGVAGHAGLFSTATDLAIFCQMLLQQGRLQVEGRSVRILSPRTVTVMTSPQRVSSGIRGLGWDKQTGYSSNRGDLLTPSAFGHGGFTGTVLWIDPELELFYIFLSNRVHPDGKGSVNHLAGQILNRIVSSVTEP